MRTIVERAMRGDREAFGVLVAQTSDRMFAVAVRILRDGHLGEDALQGATDGSVNLRRHAVPLNRSSNRVGPRLGCARRSRFATLFRLVPGPPIR